MKILITGISGFVGPYLKNTLKGHEVIGVDRHSAEYVCDLLDKDKVFEIISIIKPEVIIHLAGQSSVKKSYSDPNLTREINVFGTKNLLDAVVNAKISPKILIVSSSEVYGTLNRAALETDKYHPENPYAKSRVEQEELALSYDLPIIIARSYSHTGPGQNPNFVFSSFTKQIVEIENGDKKQLLVGNLSVKRDFSDVRDIVNAYRLLIEKGKTKQVYNVCSSVAKSLSEYIDYLKSISKVEFEVKIDKTRLRPTDIPLVLGDNNKLKKETGWDSKYSFEQTLKEMLDYWRSHD